MPSEQTRAIAPRPVLARDDWETNGHLIADVARLGYLRAEWRTLDATYGEGTFWKVWRPDELVGCDLNPAKSPIGRAVDFTDLPFKDREFPAVVFDGPYKLNGRPDEAVDARYGVDEMTTWRDRMSLLRAGVRECARVCDQNLLVKVQDQVHSSVIRWQSIAMRDEVLPLGFELRARFDFPSYRPQPGGRAQKNPCSVSSQLLVFTRGWSWTDLADDPAPSLFDEHEKTQGCGPTDPQALSRTLNGMASTGLVNLHAGRADQVGVDP